MGKLELKLEGAKGWRHYLEGRSVRSGELLEIKVNGEWVTGHYEWSFILNKRPLLCFNDHTKCLIWQDDQLRWVDQQDNAGKAKSKLLQDEFVQTSTRRILVVDHSDEGSATLVDLLSDAGFEVHKACNGVEALMDARAFHPDVVLLGLSLPLVNGYAIAHCFREEHGANLILIALLNRDLEIDLQHARHSGFDAHLRKPIALATLLSFMN